jgi:hypothetical protein
LGLSRTDFEKKPLTSRDWLLLNEASLLRLTRGEVYHDSLGVLTKLREYFKYFPDDVWRYKLAYQWETLSWDIDLIGLCAHRGDVLSARIATARSVERFIRMIFLLNRRYQPGYLKWLHREFYKLPFLVSEIGPALQKAIICTDFSQIVESFYPVIDRLIEFQSDYIHVPMLEYRKPADLEPGFFAYNLRPVFRAVRSSIKGEFSEMPTTVGALDQWVTDQDILMVPSQLRMLGAIFSCEAPSKVLFERDRFDEWV